MCHGRLDPSSTKCLEVLCARWCGTGIPARFCDTLQMICWLPRQNYGVTHSRPQGTVEVAYVFEIEE
ncbi:hypothetical protein QR685DRAFT_523657 [Neurospora intermedia]|uniref:Uncharacterized protein n=1 Tax=Neurospora intermedia TaxID=5142 RepID=A0ABR3DFC4_NEUIN